MEDKKYSGTTWLSIYTFLFVVRTIGMTITVISTIAACAQYGLFNDSYALPILVILLLEYAFEVFALVCFLKKTELGYKVNMIYIFASTFISAFNVYFRHVMEGSAQDMFFSVVIACIAMLAVWSVPNYIYFKHRKFLFAGDMKERKTTDEERQKKMSAKEIPSSLEVTSSEATGSSTANSNEQKTSQVEKNAVTKPPVEMNKGSIPLPVKELKLLKELHDTGVLSNEEFEKKKKDLLGI